MSKTPMNCNQPISIRFCTDRALVDWYWKFFKTPAVEKIFRGLVESYARRAEQTALLESMLLPLGQQLRQLTEREEN